MNRLLQSVDAIRRHFSRRISGAALGIIVEEHTPGDLAALGALARRGRLPLVRTENRGDPESAERVMAFLEVDCPLLVTVPFGRGFGPVGPGITLQIDHEPDRQNPAVSPEHYGQTFRATMRAMRQTLPSTIPIVTAGFSDYASAAWIADALVAGAWDADAVCFHAAGPAPAVLARIAVLQEAMALAHCDKPLWLTELRPSGWSHHERAESLQACLALPALRAVARVYVYTLASKDADLLGLCDADLSRTPRPTFGVLRSAMRRP